MSKLHLNITGMTCVNCANAITRATKKIKGVKSASISLSDNSGIFELENQSVEQKIIEKIKALGFGVAHDFNELLIAQAKEQKVLAIKLAISAVSSGLIMLFHFGLISASHDFIALSSLILCSLCMLCGTSFYTHALRSLKEKNFDMNTLVSLGVFSAFFYSLFAYFAGSHELYFDSPAMIISFVLLGKFLESKARAKTSLRLKSLMDLKPKIAHLLLADGTEKQIKASELKIGDIISIKPGEHAPSDAIITYGGAEFDESAINGESLPRYKSVGENIFGGSTNINGTILAKIAKNPKESLLEGIISSLQQSASKKLNIARLADKISNIFVPSVIGVSLLTLIIWSFFDVNRAAICAISVLVISCPCALGLATPIAIVCALSKGSKSGILIKNPAIIELIKAAKIVAFDKTGTLTKGSLSVSATSLNDDDLRLAGFLSKASSHPISKAISKYASTSKGAKGIKELAGLGIEYEENGVLMLLGSIKLLQNHGVVLNESQKEQILAQNAALALLAVDGEYRGFIALSDEIKEGAKELISKLKAKGLKCVMLSGDNDKNAGQISRELRLDEYHAGLLPNEKVELLRGFGGSVIFVGDGINDALAMKEAMIGVAISNSSDISKDASDIIIIKDDIKALSELFSLGQKALKIIKQNLFWAFCYNALCIPLAAGVFGGAGVFLTPAIAAFAMSSSSVIVVLNSLRLLR
nr:cation-translocating P-type ATPase [uncultured Campylobacter sp.]